VAVDLAVSADSEVRRRDRNQALVHVLVDTSVKELALDDARVLLGRLVDANGVIGEVEGDDESAVEVLGDACVETRCETEDLLVVVHGLEEVALGLLGHQAVHLALRVLLVAKSVVGRLLDGHGLRGLGKLNGTKGEVHTEATPVELLRELVHTRDFIDAAVGADARVGRDLVASQVVIADESLAWLVHVEAVRELLASEKESEGVAAVVGSMRFSDLESVVS
jgi:hypothetical protein